MNIRRTLIAPLLALAVLLAGCGAGSPLLEGGDTAPSSGSGAASDAADTAQTVYLGDFTAQTLDGEAIDQTVFQGHALTVVNVWATFCGPCKDEMPILAKLDGEMGDEVQFLGVVTDVTDQDLNPDQAQVDLAAQLAEAAGVAYRNLQLNESLAMLGFAGLQAVPATLFVDANGCLVGQGFYGALDEENWRTVIEERLEQARQQAERADGPGDASGGEQAV